MKISELKCEQWKQSSRYAHHSGHTDLGYSSDGRFVVTCGSDGDVRVWRGLEDEDPQSVSVVQIAHCIACTDDSVIYGDESVIVTKLKLPDFNPEGVVTRFGASCTAVAASNDGQYVIAGASDSTMHFVDTKTKNTEKLDQHTGGILSITIDPQQQFFASSGTEGNIIVWSMKDRQVVRKWHNTSLISNDPFTAHFRGKCSFVNISGPQVVIPMMKEVHVVSPADEKGLKVYQIEVAHAGFSVTAVSSDKKLMAAGTACGIVCVFDLLLHSMVTAVQVGKVQSPVTGLAWNPSIRSGNAELAVTDGAGQLSAFLRLSSHEEPSDTTESLKTDIASYAPNSPSNSSITNEPTKPQTVSHGEETEEGTKLDIDSESSDEELGDLALEEKPHRSRIFQTSPFRPNIQGHFQPGSTPNVMSNYFLVYNVIGTVTVCQDASEKRTVDVEFHDTSIHPDITIPDDVNYDVGCLSSTVFALSSTSETDSNNTSSISGMSLKAGTHNLDWTRELPQDETVQGLAAGEHFVVAATSAHHLRFFTPSGYQREILGIPGQQFVALAAFDTNLAVVFAVGSEFSGTQSLSVQCMRVTYADITSEPPQLVCLSPSSNLSWVGWSEDRLLCTLDTNGVIRALMGYHWKVIGNERDMNISKSDHLFLHSINVNNKTAYGVVCRGARYPPTLPRPILGMIELKTPLVEPQTTRTIREDMLMEYKFLLARCSNDTLPSHDRMEAVDRMKKIQAEAFSLIRDAVPTKQRVYDVYSMLPTEQMRKMTRMYLCKKNYEKLAEMLEEAEDTIRLEYAHNESRQISTRARVFQQSQEYIEDQDQSLNDSLEPQRQQVQHSRVEPQQRRVMPVERVTESSLDDPEVLAQPDERFSKRQAPSEGCALAPLRFSKKRKASQVSTPTDTQESTNQKQKPEEKEDKPQAVQKPQKSIKSSLQNFVFRKEVNQ